MLIVGFRFSNINNFHVCYNNKKNIHYTQHLLCGDLDFKSKYKKKTLK